MTLIAGLADRILLSWGWPRVLIALVAGATSALALPPLGLFPVLALTFPVLVWLLDGASPDPARSRILAPWPAFVVGWWFGFGYFLAGLWWIGTAFLVDAEIFAWLLPVGVAGLPALLAIFFGIGTALARLVWTPGPWRIAALAFGLGLAEYLRGTVLTGFPWNAVGYALTATDTQMQAASLVGVYGLTVIAVFAFASPAALLTPAGRFRRSRIVVPAIALALLGGQAAYGAWRLATATDASVPGVTLRLVQPNLTQTERRDASRHLGIFERYLRLTAAPARDGRPQPTHVIWPESALPFLIEGAPGALSRIGSSLRPGTTLIAGLQRPDPSGPGAFNALYVFDDQARVIDRYDKIHLVPFGEYLPFPDLMSAVGLEPLTRVLAFVAGTRRTNMTAGAAPAFGPLICYEIIFPGAAVRADERPGWLVNVSDDSWFGRTIGPRQHLHQARVRAVEEGLPVARATTTGVSAVIDGYGRTAASLPLHVEDVLDAPLPVALAPTPFGTYGNILAGVLIIISLFLAFFARIGFRTTGHHGKGVCATL